MCRKTCATSVVCRRVSLANEFLTHSAAHTANPGRRDDEQHKCRRFGDGGVGGDGQRGATELPLPGEEISAVAIAVVVGVEASGRRPRNAFPDPPSSTPTQNVGLVILKRSTLRPSQPVEPTLHHIGEAAFSAGV